MHIIKTYLFLLFFFTNMVHAEGVRVNITNIGGQNGKMAVAVFDNPNHFPDNNDDLVYADFVTIPNHSSSFKIDLNLKPGIYAIALYLDENGNQKLDKNFMGIPKERFGFSNNPGILRGAPVFEECQIEIKTGVNEIDIRLKKML